MDIDGFTPKRASEINSLPQGLIAEVFFLNACRQSAIDCEPSFGDEDVLGADFKITHGNETRFFDVSINTSGRSVKKKVKEGTFPTLFLPWKESLDGSSSSCMTYAEKYLKYGTFDGRNFLCQIISSNYFVLDSLRRRVWRNEDPLKKVFNHESVDLSESGIQYVRNLDGVLMLLRRAI